MCKTMHTSGRQGDDITNLKLSVLSPSMQWITYSFTYSMHKKLYYHMLIYDNWKFTFIWLFFLFVFVF